MKNQQKGSAGVIVLIIIVIVLLGVIGYMYFNQSTSTNQIQDVSQGVVDQNTQTPIIPNQATATSPVSQIPGWKTYTDSQLGFVVQYPAAFSVIPGPIYHGDDNTDPWNGITFSIPAGMYGAGGSAQMSVQINPHSSTCSVSDFQIPLITNISSVTKNNIIFSTATGGDGGAGQIYDDTIYTTANHNPCYGLMLTVHISKSDPSLPSAGPFDEAKANSDFLQIVSSFTFTK